MKTLGQLKSRISFAAIFFVGVFYFSGCSDCPDPPVCANGLKEVDCECICPQENVYYQGENGNEICFEIRGGYLDTDEIYVFDQPHDFPYSCPGLTNTIFLCHIDWDHEYGIFEELFPFTARIDFVGGAGLTRYFYMKNGSRDTLFMDQYAIAWEDVRLWNACVGGEKQPFFYGYAVRTDAGLDWKLDLYDVSNEEWISPEFDQSKPDTTIHFHMPLLLKR